MAAILSPAVDALLTVAAVVGAMVVILRPVRAAALALLHIRDDWDEIKERLAALEELRPNHGTSIHDKVSTLRERQEEIADVLARHGALISHMSRFFDGTFPPDLIPEED